MGEMKSIASSITKNQVSIHTWKDDSGTETSPGTVKPCELYGHEATMMGRFFQTIPPKVVFFPQLIST